MPNFGRVGCWEVAVERRLVERGRSFQKRAPPPLRPYPTVKPHVADLSSRPSAGAARTAPRRAKPTDWGSELPDDPPSINRAIARRSGFDLSRDAKEQLQARAAAGDPVRAPLAYSPRSTSRRGSRSGAGRPTTCCSALTLRGYLTAHAAAALLAAGLALIVLTPGYVWPCQLVVIWTLSELATPGVPLALWPHLVGAHVADGTHVIRLRLDGDAGGAGRSQGSLGGARRADLASLSPALPGVRP